MSCAHGPGGRKPPAKTAQRQVGIPVLQGREEVKAVPVGSPLETAEVNSIASRCLGLWFDRLYGGFPESVIGAHAHAARQRSATRNLGMLDRSWPRG